MQDIGYHIAPQIKGLETPGIRHSSIDRPVSDGAITVSHLYGGRLISMIGNVHGQNSSEYRSRRMELIRSVRIRREDGEIIPIEFRFTTDNDLELSCEVLVDSFDFPDEYMNFGQYKLDLFANTHILLSQAQKSTNIFLFTGGGFTIPFEVPLDMSEDASTVSILVNDGNAPASPHFTFFGPLTNPILTNETNGEQIKVNRTIGSGERVEVDTREGNQTVLFFTATDDLEGDNILQDFQGDFMKLSRGGNYIRLTNPTINNEAFVQVRWHDSYLGV